MLCRLALAPPNLKSGSWSQILFLLLTARSEPAPPRLPFLSYKVRIVSKLRQMTSDGPGLVQRPPHCSLLPILLGLFPLTPSSQKGSCAHPSQIALCLPSELYCGSHLPQLESPQGPLLPFHPTPHTFEFISQPSPQLGCLLPHQHPGSFSRRPGTLLPQGLCAGCFPCLKFSSPRDPSFKVFTQMLPSL